MKILSLVISTPIAKSCGPRTEILKASPDMDFGPKLNIYLSSMSISLDNLAAMLGTTQVSYNRINATEFIQSALSKPEPTCLKQQVPQYFRDMFPSGFNLQVITPSGTENSIWHSLLYAFSNERYMMASWEQKKKYVEKLVEELDQKTNVTYSKSSLVSRNTKYSPSDLKFRARFITDDVLFAICGCLSINILIVGPVNLQFHYCEPVFNGSLPLIILYKDHQQCYGVITVNDCLSSSQEAIETLKPKFPDRNIFLSAILKPGSRVTDSDREFIRLIKGQSNEEATREQETARLSGLKVAELKSLLDQRDIKHTGRLTKARAIELLMQ